MREVYAIETLDENEEVCFVIKNSHCTGYDSDSFPEGIVGVAYSLESAKRFAQKYITAESEEVRKKFYQNHTLVDKTVVD